MGKGTGAGSRTGAEAREAEGREEAAGKEEGGDRRGEGPGAAGRGLDDHKDRGGTGHIEDDDSFYHS